MQLFLSTSMCCMCVCVCVMVDACYIVSFAIIMLNTSLHNSNVKHKVWIHELTPTTCQLSYTRTQLLYSPPWSSLFLWTEILTMERTCPQIYLRWVGTHTFFLSLSLSFSLSLSLCVSCTITIVRWFFSPGLFWCYPTESIPVSSQCRWACRGLLQPRSPRLPHQTRSVSSPPLRSWGRMKGLILASSTPYYHEGGWRG